MQFAILLIGLACFLLAAIRAFLILFTIDYEKPYRWPRGYWLIALIGLIALSGLLWPFMKPWTRPYFLRKQISEKSGANNHGSWWLENSGAGGRNVGQ